ncbi:proteinase-activated receptor 1 [Scyliorhinus torazame]|uniref:proteinase-activated receptor 1 n=1 Tax=Scyliorhinus torazame TaxID=75743 RepID=UPI003B597547
MDGKVQFVLWVALLLVIYPHKSDTKHLCVNNIRKTFAAECNNDVTTQAPQQNISGNSSHELNKTLQSSTSKSSANAMPVSEEAKYYLLGYWTTLAIPVVYSFVFIVSLPLNLLAIFIFLFKMQVSKPFVIYMMNLAAADLLFVLLLPLKIAYNFSGNNWGFGSFLCRLVTGGFYAYMYCSVLLMMCISIDRFLAIVYPIRSASWRSRGRTVVFCLVSWLAAIGGTLPLFLTEQTMYITELNITTCHDVQPLSVLQNYSSYYFPTLCFLLFVIPLLVTSVCYICIISTLHSASQTEQCGKRHAFFMAVIVLSVFIVCFAPSNIILLIHYLQFYSAPSDSLYFAYLLCVCIGSVSCCLDPLIYYYVSTVFRSKLSNLYLRKFSDSQTKEPNQKLHCIYRKLLASRDI